MMIVGSNIVNKVLIYGEAAFDIIAVLLASPYTLSVLTAIFTVGVTLYAHNVRDEINSLRALKSEAKINQELYNSQITFLDDSIGLESDFNVIQGLSRNFSQNSFEQAKNSGTLLRFDRDLQDKIETHYDLIRDINQVFGLRQELYLSESDEQGTSLTEKYIQGDDVSQITITRIDALALKSMYPLDPDRFRKIDNVDTFKELYKFESLDQIYSDFELKDENVSFENLIEDIDSEIDDYRLSIIF
jgi:hypothetical protein